LIRRALAALVVAGWALFCLPALGRAQALPLPVVVQADGITVRAEAGMDRLARHVAKLAAPTLVAILADLPRSTDLGSIEIRLVKRSDDLARAAPPGRGAPKWAIGVAYPDVGVVVVAFRNGPLPADIDEVVAHELAHLALGAALGDKAPRWLHEGFAFLHSSSFSLDRARTLSGMAWSGNVIPLHELDRRFPAAKIAASRAYAESYDFVAFLARRGRLAGRDDDGNRWPFRQFLAQVSEGVSLADAARGAFKADLDRLFEEWRESLRQRYLMLPVGMFGALVWILAAFLLILAYLRKRRIGRKTLARWAIEERGREPPPLVPLRIEPPPREPNPDATDE